MKKNRLFLTSLVIGTVMLGGCSKDVEPEINHLKIILVIIMRIVLVIKIMEQEMF